MLNVCVVSPTTSLVNSFLWGLVARWGFFPSTFGFCSSAMIDRAPIDYAGTFLIIMLMQRQKPLPYTGRGS